MDLIASFLVRGLNLVFHVMPIGFNLWLGRCFGAVFYVLSGKRGSITYANLKAAFSKEKSPEEIKHLTGRVYKNLAETFMEILSMTKVNKRYIEKYVKMYNFERIENASKNPKGMILASAHFGNWELSTVTSVMKGYPLYLLARDQKMRRMNELLNTLRELKGNVVIRKGADIKNIFRVLRDGKAVGILADQNAGHSGKLIDLFERPASTAMGPYRFAQKSGAWIVPAFIHRKKGPYHELAIEEPMVIKKGEDLTPYLVEYNRLLEKHIRTSPEQWLWMHKKWKLTPVKKIMVLDDGKKGHLNQTLSVVKQIKRYREDKGFLSAQTSVDVVKIEFKHKAAKIMFNLLSPLFTRRCQGCLKCLKRALTVKSYAAIVPLYADVILSCGSSLFGVNKIMKIENDARNLTVLDPGFLNRNAFNLIVLPKHDLKSRTTKSDKIIVTDLSPNLVTPNKCYSLSTIHYSRTLGLLFGGNNSHFEFSPGLTSVVAEAVKAACKKTGGHFYATTSRRTPESSEEILENMFKENEQCVKFIKGRQDADERTVEKILAACDILIVSGESVSMVSEAVSSGKQVLVFMPNKKTTRYTKYEKFSEGLQTRGYIKLVKPENIQDEVEKAFFENIKPARIPDDNERMYKEMYKLF
ncbi:MAG: ELM1/GtrOC1 family putative glycosyltransferase [Candidatus Omnitrophota bacterium]